MSVQPPLVGLYLQTLVGLFLPFPHGWSCINLLNSLACELESIVLLCWVSKLTNPLTLDGSVYPLQTGLDISQSSQSSVYKEQIL